MYSHLRFVTAASLIAFGGIIGVGALALLPPALELPRVAGAEIPDPPAIPCKQQTWLHFDRNCLSRRDLPWVAERGTARAVTVEVPSAAVEQAPEQPSVPRQHTATMEPQRAVTVPQEVPRESASEITAPEQGLPVPPPTAEERHVAKPTIQSQPRLPASKKAARGERAAKRPTNEALKAVRRFGDILHDIPVSAYAADGTRRSIVIRPTSVQDVYYYSVPR